VRRNLVQLDHRAQLKNGRNPGGNLQNGGIVRIANFGGLDQLPRRRKMPRQLGRPKGTLPARIERDRRRLGCLHGLHYTLVIRANPRPHNLSPALVVFPPIGVRAFFNVLGH